MKQEAEEKIIRTTKKANRERRKGKYQTEIEKVEEIINLQKMKKN